MLQIVIPFAFWLVNSQLVKFLVVLLLYLLQFFELLSFKFNLVIKRIICARTKCYVSRYIWKISLTTFYLYLIWVLQIQVFWLVNSIKFIVIEAWETMATAIYLKRWAVFLFEIFRLRFFTCLNQIPRWGWCLIYHKIWISFVYVLQIWVWFVFLLKHF